jgi:hypothetical protein
MNHMPPDNRGMRRPRLPWSGRNSNDSPKYVKVWAIQTCGEPQRAVSSDRYGIDAGLCWRSSLPEEP